MNRSWKLGILALGPVIAVACGGDPSVVTKPGDDDEGEGGEGAVSGTSGTGGTAGTIPRGGTGGDTTGGKGGKAGSGAEGGEPGDPCDGVVCDRGMHCVDGTCEDNEDCDDDLDCTEAKYCANGTCTDDDCTPDTKSCDGNALAERTAAERPAAVGGSSHLLEERRPAPPRTRPGTPRGVRPALRRVRGRAGARAPACRLRRGHWPDSWTKGSPPVPPPWRGARARRNSRTARVPYGNRL